MNHKHRIEHGGHHSSGSPPSSLLFQASMSISQMRTLVCLFFPSFKCQELFVQNGPSVPLRAGNREFVRNLHASPIFRSKHGHSFTTLADISNRPVNWMQRDLLGSDHLDSSYSGTAIPASCFLADMLERNSFSLFRRTRPNTMVVKVDVSLNTPEKEDTLKSLGLVRHGLRLPTLMISCRREWQN